MADDAKERQVAAVLMASPAVATRAMVDRQARTDLGFHGPQLATRAA
jgi:hypothetical protein